MQLFSADQPAVVHIILAFRFSTPKSQYASSPDLSLYIPYTPRNTVNTWFWSLELNLRTNRSASSATVDPFLIPNDARTSSPKVGKFLLHDLAQFIQIQLTPPFILR